MSAIAEAAAKASLVVILGAERVVGDVLLITALVIDRDGTLAGFQDKVQLDPSEEGIYAPGFRRRVFQTGSLTFGIAICHEKAALCRTAENTCYFATVNCAGAGSPTTSAIVQPDGTLLNYQPYGKHGLLVADIDITAATGLLAARCKSGYSEQETPAGAPVGALSRTSPPATF